MLAKIRIRYKVAVILAFVFMCWLNGYMDAREYAQRYEKGKTEVSPN